MNNSLIVKKATSGQALTAQDAKDIVAFISENTNEINSLSIKIQEAKKAADKAKSNVQSAKSKAESIRSSAYGRSKTHWWNSKSAAINDVKDDVKDLADAQVELADTQISLAEAQQKSAEAHRKTFEFEERLAKLTSVMIQVGTASIATNQLMVRELEARLNGASKAELSEMARTEIESVVYQIKAQQDILSKQEQLTDIVHEIDNRVSSRDEQDKIRDKAIEEQMQQGMNRDVRISAQEQKTKEHGRIIAHQIRKDEEQDRTLAAMAETDEEQDALIAQNADKNVEQDRVLVELSNADEAQDVLIAQNADKNLEQDHVLDELTNTVAMQATEINSLKLTIESLKAELAKKGNKLLLIATSIASAGALIISIVSLFV